MDGSTGSPLFLRRGRFAVACIAAALGAAAPACLPDVAFGPTSMGTDGGTDGGGSSPPDGRAPAADATTDSSDARAGDSSVDGASDVQVDAYVDPNAFRVFAADLTDSDDPGFCAVRGDTLYCWGDNGANVDGQLGLPPDTPTDGGHTWPTIVPSTEASPSLITMMAMGARHACSLYGRATYCRGDNGYSQLGNPQATSDVPAEAPVEMLPAGGLDFIAAAQMSTCGITLIPDAGSVSNVFCWGTNGEGELGRPIGMYPQTAEPVTGDVDGGPLGTIPDAIVIAGGGFHHCAISTSQGILCWGSTTFMESGPVAGAPNCPGGNASTCRDQPAQVPLPPGETPTALALGEVHSCALTASGNVYCWGWNIDDELGNGAALLPQMCTDHDGNTGPCTGTPVKVAISNVKILRAGGKTTCAIDDMRHTYCWGQNDIGEIGNGTWGTNVDSPQEVLDSTSFEPFTFDDISVGSNAACASDGDSLYCWGGGTLGTAALDGGMPSFTWPAPVQFF
jgi:alpha-tubulin suppressor-like RCC1 family protein